MEFILYHLPWLCLVMAVAAMSWPIAKIPRVKVSGEEAINGLRRWANQIDNPILRSLLKPEGKVYAYYDRLLKNAGFPWGLTPKELVLLKPVLPGLYLFYLLLKLKLASLFGLKTDISMMTVFVFSYSFLIPEMVLIYLAGSREKAIRSELSRVYMIFKSCLKAGARVDQSLFTASRPCKVLKAPIETAVNQWSQGAHIAIQRMVREVGHEQFDLFGLLVAESVHMKREDIDGFFNIHQEKLIRLRQGEQEARKQGEKLFLELALFIPLLILGIVMIFPIHQMAMDALSSFSVRSIK